MRIKKITETTPTMASIIDWYSTSSQDGYSCDYINIINTYDGDEGEMFTGKTWIDGKKIYRKVLTANAGSYIESGMRFSWIGKSSYDPNNVVNAISYLYGIAYASGRTFYGGSKSFEYVLLSDGRIQLGVESTNTSTSTVIKIIIEYTKTTD